MVKSSKKHFSYSLKDCEKNLPGLPAGREGREEDKVQEGQTFSIQQDIVVLRGSTLGSVFIHIIHNIHSLKNVPNCRKSLKIRHFRRFSRTKRRLQSFQKNRSLLVANQASMKRRRILANPLRLFEVALEGEEKIEKSIFCKNVQKCASVCAKMFLVG